MNDNTVERPAAQPPRASGERADIFDVFAEGGDSGALMRSIAWEGSALGPVQSWPRSLRTAVSICLSSRFPMAVCWGTKYWMLYNDGYRQILGSKHPWAMGRPCFEVWSELAHIVEPMFDSVMATGNATWSDDLMLPMYRYGYLEEAYFTVSYSAIRGDDNKRAGVLVTVNETTERYIVERRLRIIRELGDAGGRARSCRDALRQAVDTLAAHPADVPFSLVYQYDPVGDAAVLVGGTGVREGHLRCPERIPVSESGASPWPLHRTLTTREPVLQTLSGDDGLPGGIHPEPACTAIVSAIWGPASPAPIAFLVLGVNPRRALDDRHYEFFRMVTQQVEGAVTNALVRSEILGRGASPEDHRFRQLVEQLHVGVVEADLQGRFTFTNERFRDLVGRTAAELSLADIEDVIVAEDWVRAAEKLTGLAVYGTPCVVECRLVKPDGSHVWAQITAARVEAHDGDPLGIAAVVLDVTQRRLAEQALAVSEARYRTIFELAEVSIWEEDFSRVKHLLDGLGVSAGAVRDRLRGDPALVEDAIALVRVRDVNAASLRLFGASSKEQLMGSLNAVFTDETWPVFIEELVAVAEERSAFSAEVTLRSLRGEPIEAVLSMGFGSLEQPYDRVLVTLTDISARKVVDKERDARVGEMERIVRFSEMFVGILGHDLRNPLNAIMMAASVLSRTATTERLAKPVAGILSSADRMERMISQILDFTRVRLGRGIPLVRTPMDLGDLCLAVVEELEAATGCDIRLAVMGDARGVWDSDRLGQLVSNLVGNACHHGDLGRPVLVEVDGLCAKEVHVRVVNEGVIAADVAARLFEPMTAAEARGTRRRSSGLGLGLYITQQIAVAHGGTISADSHGGHRTRFTVTLPRTPGVADDRVFSNDEGR